MKFICLQNEHNAIFLFSRELAALQKSIATGRDFLPLLSLWGNQNILQNKQNNPTNSHSQNKCRKCSNYKKQSDRLPQPSQFLPWVACERFSKFSPNSFQKSQLLFLPDILVFPEVRKGSWEEELEEDKLALALAKLSLEILACHFFCGIYFFHWLKQRKLFWGQSSSLLLLLQCWDKSCQNPQK